MDKKKHTKSADLTDDRIALLFGKCIDRISDITDRRIWLTYFYSKIQCFLCILNQFLLDRFNISDHEHTG